MFTGVLDFRYALPTLVRNACGNLSPDEKSYIPESEWPKAVRGGAVAHGDLCGDDRAGGWRRGRGCRSCWSACRGSTGRWHMVLTGLLQHIGLADNVIDHRLNTRTVYMNPVSRFIYWNMNYHVEHHMFPMVPYHALPRLHELIKHDLPEPNPSMWHAYKEVWPVVLRQLRYEDFYLLRSLPATARPYRAEFHDLPTQAAE